MIEAILNMCSFDVNQNLGNAFKDFMSLHNLKCVKATMYNFDRFFILSWTVNLAWLSNIDLGLEYFEHIMRSEDSPEEAKILMIAEGEWQERQEEDRWITVRTVLDWQLKTRETIQQTERNGG